MTLTNEDTTETVEEAPEFTPEDEINFQLGELRSSVAEVSDKLDTITQIVHDMIESAGPLLQQVMGMFGMTGNSESEDGAPSLDLSALAQHGLGVAPGSSSLEDIFGQLE